MQGWPARASRSRPTSTSTTTATRVPGLPSELHADGESNSVRKFTEDGKTVGSEWIYSDDTGTRERRDTRDLQMTAPHYGAQGMDLKEPEYG